MEGTESVHRLTHIPADKWRICVRVLPFCAEISFGREFASVAEFRVSTEYPVRHFLSYKTAIISKKHASGFLRCWSVKFGWLDNA